MNEVLKLIQQRGVLNSIIEYIVDEPDEPPRFFERLNVFKKEGHERRKLIYVLVTGMEMMYMGLDPEDFKDILGMLVGELYGE